MKKEVKTLTKLALIVGLLLDFIDEIEVNKLWFKKLKQIGSTFKKELEKHDKLMIGDMDITTSQEFVNGYQAISNLIDFNLTLSDNQLVYFNQDIEQVINKYNKIK